MSFGTTSNGQVMYNPFTNQYYVNTANTQNQLFGGNINRAATGATWDQYQKQGLVKILGGPTSAAPAQSQFNKASISTSYTPNQYTANQLAGLNGNGGGMGGNANTIPRWMQQAYANKMAGMQAPANGPLPYKLTDSSYRGMPASGSQVAPVGVAGKAAPKAGA